MWQRHALLFLLCVFPVTAGALDAESYDIYAIPSRAVVGAVAQASGQLAGVGLRSFYSQGHAVHVTLYLTRYPADAEIRLKRVVAAIARCQSPLPLAVRGIDVTASNWVFVHVDWSTSLQRLADTVTLAAAPFRDSALQPPAWMAAYPAKLPAFQRYGSPNVFMQFEPHLTLLANASGAGLASFVASAKNTLRRRRGALWDLASEKWMPMGKWYARLPNIGFHQRRWIALMLEWGRSAA